LPLSAKRGMASAETNFLLRVIFFIVFLFCRGGLPHSHEMVELSFQVFPNFKNQQVQQTLSCYIVCH
jgi:hypothetical protein